MTKMDFTDEQVERYAAQIVLEEIGGKGQWKLMHSTIGIVGAGGLGCPAIQVLAGIGVGKLKIADGDIVQLSNLSRQLLYRTKDIEEKKVEISKKTVSEMNQNVEVEIFDEYLNSTNVVEFLNDCDFVIDASDNLATKFLINDACMYLKKPLIIGGVIRWFGQILSVIPGETACYRCIFGSPIKTEEHMNCSTIGVIDTITTMVGAIEGNEAIKSILGLRSKYPGHLYMVDMLNDENQLIRVEKDPECPACSNPDDPYFKSVNYEDYDLRCDMKKR